jgi:hypothetical protein
MDAVPQIFSFHRQEKPFLFEFFWPRGLPSLLFQAKGTNLALTGKDHSLSGLLRSAYTDSKTNATFTI